MVMIALNKRNTASLILALILAGGFLWAVLTPPSLFNFLPFQIHESMRPTSISENLFIKIFDICSAVILLILSYILARSGFATYGIFSEKPK